MKKIFLILTIATAALIIYSIYLFNSEINLDKLNFIHRKIARSVIDSWENYLSSIPKDRRSIVDYDTLMSQLNFYEKSFAERIFKIDPKERYTA